jgi:hypothetical protein
MATNLTALQRVEFIDSIPFTENTQATLPTNGGLLPNDRFLHSLLLEFRGRATMPATGGPTAVNADGVPAVIERVTVEGFHRIRRQQEKIVDLRGADLALMQRIYLPSPLISTPTSLTLTANATNDIITQVLIPFVPLRIAPNVQGGYLLDAPNYESLKLTLTFGDWKSIFTDGTTAPTWSAYGASTGSPTVRVYGGFAMNPARFAGFVPGRIFRYFAEITGSIPTTTASGVRLFDVPRGFDIRSVMLKTGVKDTAVSAGNNAFSAWTDFLADMRFNVGLGKYIRRYLDGNANYADLATSYNLSSRIAGVNVFDFCQNGVLSDALNTRPLIGGPTGNVDVYLSADVTGASNQAIVAIIEEVRYRPLVAK